MPLPRILTLLLISFTALWAETTIKDTYMVTMRDGVALATDIYRPQDQKKHPVILHRTPYGKSTLPFDQTVLAILNLKSYAVVAQDTRGRFASQGQDSLFFTDGWSGLQDGYDTIEWLTRQSWCNGKIAVFGASANGITAYRAVGSLHPALKCAVVIVAASDFYHQVVYPGGVYQQSLCERWIHDQGSDYLIPYYLQKTYYDDVWANMNLHTRTDSITIPILHISGWYDCFSQGPVATFQDLAGRANAGPQKLIMGPWDHYSIGQATQVGELSYPAAAYDLSGYILNWLDHWLLNIPNGVEKRAAVTYYLMGDPGITTGPGCQWLEADTWPPQTVAPHAYFFHADGELSTQPSAQIASRSWLFDPQNPVPTMGGNNLDSQAGPRDQRTVSGRADVVNFTTQVLAQPLRLEGTVQAKLFFSSDALDTDFTLKLIDVYPDGREMLVVDGIARARFRNGDTPDHTALLTPGQPDSLTVFLPPTAIVFDFGHKVKFCLSSSNYPRYAVNPNTGGTLYSDAAGITAHNSLFVGGTLASRAILPVAADPTKVQTAEKIPATFHLSAAYPNPFNGATRLDCILSAPGRLRAHVFNARGQCVTSLSDQFVSAGVHHLQWDGKDDRSRPQASGMYIIQVQSGQWVETQKVVLLQ